MRRALRAVGTLLVVAGLGLLGWAVLVWQWEDPFTSVYTAYEQRKLEQAYEERLRSFAPVEAEEGDAEATEDTPAAGGDTAVPARVRSRAVAEAARRYRQSLGRGDAIGRLKVPRMGVDMLVVEGTDSHTLKKGPGRYRRSFLPGERRLVYVAGHRTTYGAPFARIERLREGDRVELELPYATFEYRITGHRIVDANALEVLRPGTREVLALQACHPRFFASHRWIAYATPVKVTPRGAAPYAPQTLAAS
jgi:sortase A